MEGSFLAGSRIELKGLSLKDNSRCLMRGTFEGPNDVFF